MPVGLFGLAIKITLVFFSRWSANEFKSWPQLHVGTSIIDAPADCVTILYTANACFEAMDEVSGFKKALAANSRISLEPFPIIILSKGTFS